MNTWLTWPDFRSARRDIPAGVVVFLVALPLCLGIALASGAPLFSGIIAGAVGGLVIALFSGSELSVSGPAAGLAVIVLGAIQELRDFQVFTLAVVVSGLLQLVLAQVRAGVIGDYIPNSVIKGMLAAIGVVIILKQLPHALGDDRDFEGDEAFRQPDQLNSFSEILASATGFSPGAVTVSLLGLAILVLWELPFLKRRAWTGLVPAPLLCVVAGIAANEAFKRWLPAWELLAAKDQLVQLPTATSVAAWREMFQFPRPEAILNLRVWTVGLTLALVGSIETLLCLEATDKLDPEKRISDPNRELRAQGLGNLVSGLLGGLPVTSVIVRSSANVYAGARTRLAAVVHGLLLLGAVALLPGLLNRVPLAALAAVLLAVGYKLASLQVLREMWSRGWPQFLPFAITLVAIVLTDLLRGIAVGLMAGVFFVMRSNHHSATTLVNEGADWLLRFNKDVSFVNKSEVKRRLRSVPDGARLIVDGTKALYVDNDIYDTLREFETSAGFRGIQIEYHQVFGKKPRGN